MAFGRPHRPNDPSVMSSLEAAVRQIRRPGPLELIWDWRWELGILVAGAGLSVLVADSPGLTGLAVTAGAGLAVAVVLLRWPPARARAVARAWCVITPHRVRVGCINAWVQTRRGKLPFVLRTVPTDYGERSASGAGRASPPGPTPEAWPFSPYLDGDPADDSADRDTEPSWWRPAV